MTAQSLRIGIAGITGRMGRGLVQSVRAAGGVLAGGTSREAGTPAVEDDPAFQGVPLFRSVEELAARCDVVIDFTHASTVTANAAWLEKAGVAWILGCTGLSVDDQAAVERAAQKIVVVQAANFSTGVTLVLRLAREMGAVLPADQFDAEIMEMHHRQKVDAPSGTALAIGEAVAEGRGTTLAAVREPAREGQCGPRKTGAIGFAALRGGQIVGEHELLFTSGTEQIGLSHRAFDRRVFADGAVRAAQWAGEKKVPGLYSMEDVLGLTGR